LQSFVGSLTVANMLFQCWPQFTLPSEAVTTPLSQQQAKTKKEAAAETNKKTWEHSCNITTIEVRFISNWADVKKPIWVSQPYSICHTTPMTLIQKITLNSPIAKCCYWASYFSFTTETNLWRSRWTWHIYYILLVQLLCRILRAHLWIILSWLQRSMVLQWTMTSQKTSEPKLKEDKEQIKLTELSTYMLKKSSAQLVTCR